MMRRMGKIVMIGQCARPLSCSWHGGVGLPVPNTPCLKAVVIAASTEAPHTHPRAHPALILTTSVWHSADWSWTGVQHTAPDDGKPAKRWAGCESTKTTVWHGVRRRPVDECGQSSTWPFFCWFLRHGEYYFHNSLKDSIHPRIHDRRAEGAA